MNEIGFIQFQPFNQQIVHDASTQAYIQCTSIYQCKKSFKKYVYCLGNHNDIFLHTKVKYHANIYLHNKN